MRAYVCVCVSLLLLLTHRAYKSQRAVKLKLSAVFVPLQCSKDRCVYY